MSISEKDLLDLKDQISEAKVKVSELTGQKQILMRQLKETWNCETIEQAEEKLEELSKRKSHLEKKIMKASEELEERLKDDEEDE